MAERTFKNTGKYLHIPVRDIDTENFHYMDSFRNFHYIKVYDGDRQANEFYIGISKAPFDEEKDFYTALYLGNYTGDSITLRCDDDDAEDCIFDVILEGDKPQNEPKLYPDLYSEADRQQIHFSPAVGWLNDPNGLFVKDGKFNIYFQHNPFGVRHGGVNISWGHAVSDDGVHFTEYPDAVMPADSRCSIASGSAMVDKNNFMGMGKDTVIAAYTGLQSLQFKNRKKVTQSYGQQRIYSTDGGMTFKYFDNQPMIPVPDGKEWRDPKLFEADGMLCAAVYEDIDGKNLVSFYTADDEKKWTLQSRSEDLCECPDMFEMTVCETGESLWVLYGGIGKYSVGTFKDFKFNAYTKDLYLDYGSSLYAGQSFNSGEDSSVRYHMAWALDNGEHCAWIEKGYKYIPRKRFSQAMSLISKLTLHKTPDGYRVFRTPNDNLKNLRSSKENVVISSGDKLSVPCEYEFSYDGEKTISIKAGSEGFEYNPADKRITSSNGRSCVLTSDKFKARMFVDVRSIEFFISDEISLSYFALPKEVPIVFEGIESFEAVKYTLASIWNK